MVIKKQENISILLKNFVESKKDVEMTFLYSRQGLLIAKYGRSEMSGSSERDIEEIHGAITGLAENLLEKIGMEYQIGHYGTGSFETPDHRIIFLEAGPEAILLSVCNYDTNLNELLPMAYLVVEKLAQLLEESFDFKFNSLQLPNLEVFEDYSLELDKNYSTKDEEPLFDSVYQTHHIKRKEKITKAFKLIVLGEAAVGKTTLVNSFLKKKQISDYRPTLGLSLNSQKYFLQGFSDQEINFLVYDLAGQEFFKRVRHQYYSGASCVFVIYDITRRETFDEGVDFWFKDARNELGNIPFVLIGNKIDLEDQRQVTNEEGINKARELRSFFIETSALHNINVQDTFKLIGIGLFFKSKADLQEEDEI